MLHNGPPPHTVAVCESSKGKSQFEVDNGDGKSPKQWEGRGNAGKLECIKSHSFACCCFAFKCIRRGFISVLRCWNLRPFAAQASNQPTDPPTWTAPTRASLSTAGHLALGINTLGMSTVKPRWDGPQVLSRTRGPKYVANGNTHTHIHSIKQENTSSPQCSMLVSIYNCIAGVPGKKSETERGMPLTQNMCA